MLRAEAEWLGRQLVDVPDDELFPVLNIGSHTDDFRRRDQPWIDREVFKPLRRRGGRVIHTDLRAADGVDLVGDLTEPAFIDQLRDIGVRTLLCCNVLEHIANREPLCTAMAEITPRWGHIAVTVPRSFPYHPDPIDTRFRPTPEELAAEFPDMVPRRMAIVDCGTLLTFLRDKLTAAPGALTAAALDRRRHRAGDAEVAERGEPFAPWIRKEFQVTCVLLRKTGAGR